MIKRIHNLLKSNADIIVSVFLITAAFSLSLLFSSGQASSRGEDAYFTEIPENTYTPAVYNNRTSDTQDPSDENAAVSHGYALYINGEKIGASSDEAALETMLGESAQSQASVYGDYRSVEIQDEVAYGYAAADTIDSDDVIIERLSEYKLTLAVTAYDKRESELPFTTVYVDDSEAYEGVENVSQAGKTGVIENTYEITYTNGVKTGERLVSSAVIKTPVREVISRGIKLRTETVPTGLKMFIMPYNGGITSEYGSRYLLGGTFHGGLDIAAKKAGGYCYGDYIMAAAQRQGNQAGQGHC